MMSDSPVEKDIEWSDNALGGCHKFLKKIYNLVEEFLSQKTLNFSDFTDFSTENDLKKPFRNTGFINKINTQSDL